MPFNVTVIQSRSPNVHIVTVTPVYFYGILRLAEVFFFGKGSNKALRDQG